MNSTELMLVADVPYCDCETFAVRQITCRRENDDDREYLRCPKVFRVLRIFRSTNYELFDFLVLD